MQPMRLEESPRLDVGECGGRYVTGRGLTEEPVSEKGPRKAVA